MNLILNIVQIFSLIALVIYVIKTWQIANYNKKITRAQASSSVIVYFDFPHGGAIVNLAIKNISMIPALDVKVILDPEINIKRNETKLSDLPAFRDGISFLAPGQELKFHLDSFPAFMSPEKKLATEYNVRINHIDGLDRKNHENWIKLDIKQFHFECSTNYNEELLKKLDEIKTALVEIKKNLPSSNKNRNHVGLL